MVTFFSCVSMRLRRANWAVARLVSAPVSEEYAKKRVSAPSSSRTLERMLRAMNSATSSGSLTRSISAFFWRMAIFVSRSGGWISAMRPYSKRERRRSSMEEISLGGQSEETTICFCWS